jgi:hypothetical protein
MLQGERWLAGTTGDAADHVVRFERWLAEHDRWRG